MKKIYMKPTMQAYKLQAMQIICASEPNPYPGSFGYMPDLHIEKLMA